MPNHCENDLYIQGPDDMIAAVLAHIGADKTPPQFDFNTLIPYPDPFKAMDTEMEAIDKAIPWPSSNDPERAAKLAERQRLMDVYQARWGTTSDGYNSGGHEWTRQAWGTKWGAYDVARRDYDGHTIVTYQTAWTPSFTIIQALAERFPECTFTLEYFEQGMQFCGGAQWPGENDWYEDTPWKPGICIDRWESKNYHGIRGG